MGGIASGLGDIGSGVASLFGGGNSATPAEGQPGGPELVGPPSPYASPNFMQGFVQGFTGIQPGTGADTPIGAGPQIAGGIGELMRAIQGLKDPMSTANPITGPMVSLVQSALRGPEQAQMPFGFKPASTPSNIVQNILSSYTGGILGSNKMGV